MSNYAPFMYLILCLLCAWGVIGILDNNNIVNTVTGNVANAAANVESSEQTPSGFNTEVIKL